MRERERETVQRASKHDSLARDRKIQLKQKKTLIIFFLDNKKIKTVNCDLRVEWSRVVRTLLFDAAYSYCTSNW